MTVESQHDIDGVLNAGRVVARVRDAMLNAIEPGMTTAELDKLGGGHAIQRTAKSHKFKVIRNLAGHGIERNLHEEPEGIVSYYDRRDTRRLQLGQVIAIEPFLSTRSTHVTEAEDGWTLVGHPANLSAQYEHTIIVTKGAPIVATRDEQRLGEERLLGFCLADAVFVVALACITRISIKAGYLSPVDRSCISSFHPPASPGVVGCALLIGIAR